MAIESPAYVISASSHSAALFRQATQSFISGTGVVGLNDLLTTQNGTPNMSVNVAPGFIWCPGTLGATSGIQANGNAQTSYGLPSGLTSQGCYGAYNDAAVNLPISAADPSNPRIDIVCASIQDAQYAGSNNQPVLSVVTGTAAPSPSVPSAPASSVVLSQVAVAAGATSITTSNITDERPFIGVGGRDRGISAADYNTFMVPGMYRGDGTTNAPGSGIWHVLVERMQSGAVIRQTAFSEAAAGQVWTRYYLSGTGWSTWSRLSAAAGSVTLTFSSSPNASGSVTFAAAFPSAPIVTLTPTGSNNYDLVCTVVSTTASGFTLRAITNASVSVTGSAVINYVAVPAA